MNWDSLGTLLHPLLFSILHYIRHFPSTSLCRWKRVRAPGRDGGVGGGGDSLLDNGDRKRKPASEGGGEQSTLSAFYELEQGIERGNKLVKQASLSLSQYPTRKVWNSGRLERPTSKVLSCLHRYSYACGRCCVCFVLDPVSVHSPKPKHTKHLPQADE